MLHRLTLRRRSLGWVWHGGLPRRRLLGLQHSPPDNEIEASKSLVPIPGVPQDNDRQYTLKDTLFPIDTWHWTHLLSTVASAAVPEPATPATLTRSQAAALTSCIAQLVAHRLHHWHHTLPTLPRLHHDLHLLHTVASELQRLHGVRSQAEGPTGEVHGLGEAMREGMATVRAETGQAVSEWRGEGREEVGRVEVEQHRLEGRLAASMSRFRSEAENVKHHVHCPVVVIFSILLIAVAQKTTNGGHRRRSREEGEEASLVSPGAPSAPRDTVGL